MHHLKELKNNISLFYKINPAGICILLAGILWGSMGLFVRGLNAGGFESLEIVEIRVLVSSILMGLSLIVYDKSLFKIKLKDLWCFIGTGVFSLTFFNVCYFKTILITSMSVAAILLYTAPIIVVLLSAVFFKEKITKVKIAAMILAFTGCFFVTGIVGNSIVISFKGILLGLGSGLGYALYSIFSRFALERGYKSMTISFYTFLFSLVATAFISPPVSLFRKIRIGDTVEKVILSIGIGVITTVLPYVFYTYGLTKVKNGEASIMASIEPVIAMLIGYVVYKEGMTWDQIIGVILVFVAIIILNIFPLKGEGS